uniref:Uncharacterized protein n=1 Tax=Melanopsichium pennsylvanicum 4 TaxID=1398559 RepID=A0A077R4G2_9BASI|nr:uncharacterized protein BN887_06043 [Melanopsichium pennsylvanicum 4]
MIRIDAETVKNVDIGRPCADGAWGRRQAGKRTLRGEEMMEKGQVSMDSKHDGVKYGLRSTRELGQHDESRTRLRCLSNKQAAGREWLALALPRVRKALDSDRRKPSIRACGLATSVIRPYRLSEGSRKMLQKYVHAQMHDRPCTQTGPVQYSASEMSRISFFSVLKMSLSSLASRSEIDAFDAISLKLV